MEKHSHKDIESLVRLITKTSLEQQWAYYTKYIYSMWHLPTGQLYLALKAVLAGKD